MKKSKEMKNNESRYNRFYFFSEFQKGIVGTLNFHRILILAITRHDEIFKLFLYFSYLLTFKIFVF